MKTKFIALSALAVAALALFSCAKTEVDFTTKEPIVKEKTGIPFDLTVSAVETKTVNADNATTWAAADAITLFHAVTGSTTYVYDDAFTANEAGASVKFSGTLGAALDGETNYDWYAIYPAVDDLNNTPAEYSYVTIGSVAGENQVQSGNDSKAHLAGTYFPLYGKKSNLAAATKPALSMKQMASVLAVKVTNRIPEDIVVTNVTVTCSGISDGLVGEYKVDITGENPAYTTSTVNNTAKLSVTSGDALSTGETGTFYLAVKPFTAAAGQKITIVVTTNRGTQTSVSNALGADFSFLAGKIHDLIFNFTNKALSAVEFKYNSSDWIAAQGLSAPATDKASTYLAGTTQTVSPITISSFTDGTTGTRIYNGSGNLTLRVYASGGSFTVSSTGSNLISKIAITGSGFGEDAVNATSAVGTISGDSKTIIWNGLSQDVTFNAAATLTIESITVFYQTATDSDHVVSLPLVEKGVAYNTTSTTFDIRTVNVDDLVFSSTSPGYSSYSYAANSLTVNLSENTSASPRDIVVNVTSASAGFAGILTITQAGAPTKIGTLTASSTAVTINAQVAALTKNGFILADDTGAILVYTKSDVTSTYTIGQAMKVEGDVSAYNKGLQFDVNGGKATITPGAAGSYSYPGATNYGLAEVAAFLADDANRLATYVQFSGVVVKSGSYYNIYAGLGGSDNATLYSAPTSLTSSLATGDYVTVKGYASSISSSRMAVCATEVTEDSDAPGLRFANITNVAAVGVTGATLTVTPSNLPGPAPTVTPSGCVTDASINATCTTVTYSVAANDDTTPKTGTIVITFTVNAKTYSYTVKVDQAGKVAGTEVTVNIGTYASSNSWANGTKYTTINIDSNVTATVSGSGANSGKFYTDGNEWRLYQNESPSLTINAGEKTISSVTVTYNVKNTGVLKQGDDNVTSGSAFSVGASNVVFSVGNTGSATNGQVKITSIKVVYN